MNRLRIGAAHGAELGPAARRTRGGRALAIEENAKLRRLVIQFGLKTRESQVGAAIVASVIIGRRRTMGGLNWSNKLRFMVIGGWFVGLARGMVLGCLAVGGRLLPLLLQAIEVIWLRSWLLRSSGLVEAHPNGSWESTLDRLRVYCFL